MAPRPPPPPARPGFTRRALLSSTFALGARQALVAGLTALGVLVLSHILEPSQFAYFGWTLAVMTFVTAVGDFGYGAALIRSGQARRLAGAVSRRQLRRLAVAVVLATAAIALVPLDAVVRTSALLLVVCAAFLAAQMVPTAVFEAEGRFAAIGLIEVIQRALLVAVAVALAELSVGAWATPAAGAIAAAAGFALALGVARVRPARARAVGAGAAAGAAVAVAGAVSGGPPAGARSTSASRARGWAAAWPTSSTTPSTRSPGPPSCRAASSGSSSGRSPSPRSRPSAASSSPGSSFRRSSPAGPRRPGRSTAKRSRSSSPSAGRRPAPCSCSPAR